MSNSARGQRIFEPTGGGLCHWKRLPPARNKVGEDLEHTGRDLSSFRKLSGQGAHLGIAPLNTCSQCKYLLQKDALPIFPSTHPEHLDPSLTSLGPRPSFRCRSFSHLRLALKWISLIRLRTSALC